MPRNRDYKKLHIGMTMAAAIGLVGTYAGIAATTPPLPSAAANQQPSTGGSQGGASANPQPVPMGPGSQTSSTYQPQTSTSAQQTSPVPSYSQAPAPIFSFQPMARTRAS